MTSREIVKKAIHRQRPPRLPMLMDNLGTGDSSLIRVREAASFTPAVEGKYVTCLIFMVLFERMHSLHGFENTLVDLYSDRGASRQAIPRQVRRLDHE